MLHFNIDPQVSGAPNVPLVIINRFRMPFKCLVDTGAGIPVWVGGLALFNSIFPDAVNLNQEITIFGFNKSSSNGRTARLYSIKYFVLSDGKEQLCYKNLIVALADMDEDYSMIISYSMLRNLLFQCDNMTDPINPTVTIDFPSNLQVNNYIISGATLYSELRVLLQTEDFYSSDSRTSFFSK